ncbi:hypothetical protein KA093_00045 [Candidatus Saccharibacteria bacterium]|nr:hypothetical protein [Candidatus Saccharibacteria bacterium]
MNLSNLFKSRATREAEASERRQIARVWELCYKLDFLVDYFGWPADAAWIENAKRQAEEHLTAQGSITAWLKDLNPNYTARYNGGTVEIIELPFGGRIVPLADLIRWWANSLYLGDLFKVVADDHGTRFEYGWGKVINARTGAIDPLRFADPGNRYRNACALIKEFTGVELNWRSHVGTTKNITVTKLDNGTWAWSSSTIFADHPTS